MTLKVIDGRAYLLCNDLGTYRNLLIKNTKKKRVGRLNHDDRTVENRLFEPNAI